MDRMRKILNSPSSKKKNVGGKYYGVPLEEIVRREGNSVPNAVQRICNFIQNNGKPF